VMVVAKATGATPVTVEAMLMGLRSGVEE
jgi:hypothetical protein